MLFTKQRFSTGSSRDGFLRPSADAYEFGRKTPPRVRAKSIDDLTWPYTISPLQAYLFGVITVWVLYILYQFIIFAIYSARRRRKGKKTSSKRNSRSRRPIREGDSLQPTHSSRPCAPMAKIPISPVYQPSKLSKARVHRKLSQKIRDRKSRRQLRKSRRQLRSMRAKKAATLLPTSPTYELFQHMNSHPLMDARGVNEASDIVTHEPKHSFVTTSTWEIPLDNKRSQLAKDNFVGAEMRLANYSSLDKKVGGQVVSCMSSDSVNIENRSTVHDEMGEGKDMHSECTPPIDISSTLINSSKGENNNTAEKFWDEEILFADAEKSLDQQFDKENIENFSQKESSTTKTFLTILVSNGIYDYTQKAQQREVLDLLTDLEIPHVTIDGMDQLQREKRDYFFGVSGVRGNYPQIFSSYEGSHTYLGGYDWMQSIAFDELRKIVA